MSWSEDAIEAACRHAEEWYCSLRPFEPRAFVGRGEVIGHKFPAVLSERDSVINFARFLEEEGVAFDAIHHEIPISRWMFDADHPAATKMTPGQRRRTIDLALIRPEDLATAELPATEVGFQFDAFLEFGYLSDYWTVPGARKFGAPVKGKRKVEGDVAKVGLHLAAGACRVGYVIVFEECDHGFEKSFAADAEANHHGCRVRFIRGA
jgi:hypothetical protein